MVIFLLVEPKKNEPNLFDFSVLSWLVFGEGDLVGLVGLGRLRLGYLHRALCANELTEL